MPSSDSCSIISDEGKAQNSEEEISDGLYEPIRTDNTRKDSFSFAKDSTNVRQDKLNGRSTLWLRFMSSFFSPMDWDHDINEEMKRPIHWLSPTTMILCLLLGLALSLGNHFYHKSLVSRPSGSADGQQWVRGSVVLSRDCFVECVPSSLLLELTYKLSLSNFFAYTVQASVLASVGIAYSQILWMALRKRAVTLEVLETAFSAKSCPLFIFKFDMLKDLPVSAIEALLIWCLPISLTLIPASTSSIKPSIVALPITANVATLRITDPTASHFFQYSRLANGPNCTNNQSSLFLGPRSIMSRLSVAVAAAGQIQPIVPPSVNSSVAIKFYGPTIQCHKTNETIIKINDAAIAGSQIVQNETLEFYNTYFAYVPDLSSPGGANVIADRFIDPTKSSNQLWLAYRRNGTGYRANPYPHCPTIEYRICQLYNASYHISLDFQNGRQKVQAGYPPIVLEPIDYPVFSLTAPSDMARLSYSAYFWAVTQQLIGSMGYYNNRAIDVDSRAQYSFIDTNIKITALLGSIDLSCFFADDWVVKRGSSTEQFEQRLQDIDLARNDTFDHLIPELAFNNTVSLLVDRFLGPPVSTAIVARKLLNIYAYRPLNLVPCYALSLLVATVANVWGAVAFYRNGASYDWSFWTVWSATHATPLHSRFHWRRGSLPFPPGLAKDRLVLREQRDGNGGESGGWGFEWVGRNG